MAAQTAYRFRMVQLMASRRLRCTTGTAAAAWTCPGNFSADNMTWRQSTFAAISTDRIRLLVNNALASYSRINRDRGVDDRGPSIRVVPGSDLVEFSDGCL